MSECFENNENPRKEGQINVGLLNYDLFFLVETMAE
jgi:hypothetical protein